MTEKYIAEILLDKYENSSPKADEARLLDLKNSIKNTIKVGIFHLVFKKVSGETSSMYITLDEDLIPMFNISKTNIHNENENANTLAVFAIDRNDWRSFRIDNVISLEISNNKTREYVLELQKTKLNQIADKYSDYADKYSDYFRNNEHIFR